MSDEQLAYLCSGLFLALFLVLFFVLHLPKRAQQIGTTALSVLVVFGDVSLDDEQKESQIQSITIKLLVKLVQFLAGLMVAFLLPAIALYILEKAELVVVAQVTQQLLSVPFLIVSTLIGILVWIVVKQRSKSHVTKVGKGFEVRYSSVEKVLHLFAFATRDIQLALAKIEDRFLLRTVSPQSSQPVFITALPRAGTTLLMDLCFNTGKFATHTYRDMPFVLVPLLWRRFAQRFMSKASEVERAHGDGMLVGLDSPEAFEEILWMAFWQEQYHGQQIAVWPDYAKSRFDDFFIRHQRKLIGSSSGRDRDLRYLSKNNLNIARVEFLLQMLPDAKVLIPFRSPTAHCQSLLRQHLNFLTIHQQDEFSKLYMAGVGHFDFGDNLKPVNFEHWVEHSTSRCAEDIVYWYEYWCACYRHLVAIESDRICFVDFDKLCQQPEAELRRIADFIDLSDAQLLVQQAGLLHSSNMAGEEDSELPLELANRVASLYRTLKQRATDSSIDDHN